MNSSRSLLRTLVWVICLVSLSTPALALTFSHPAEDNGTKNITLTAGTHTFTTDANPNGHHIVDWYNTYSGGSPVKSEYLYYYDDENFNLTSSGWVRAEIYGASSVLHNKLEWQASYRWNVTIVVPKEDTRFRWVESDPSPMINGQQGKLLAKLEKDNSPYYNDIQGKTVKFYVNNIYKGSDITDSNGEAEINYTPTSTSSFTLKAVFEGDSGYNGCNKSITISVQNPPKNPLLPLLRPFQQIFKFDF